MFYVRLLSVQFHDWSKPISRVAAWKSEIKNLYSRFSIGNSTHVRAPAKEPKGVNFKDDHKSDRYTNARKSIFVPASQSNLEDDEDNEEFETEKKTPSDVDNYLQADRKHSPEGQEETPIQSAFLTTESSSDQLKKSSSPPKTPPKTIHIHTHIPSVRSHTFDTDDTTGTECTKSPEVMTSSEDTNLKVNV